jgi:tRNA(Ile2)-agmatinylcytidine synthase
MNSDSDQYIWIGLDDTDEREYGCTTHDFNELLEYLNEYNYSIIDARIVRLWPFAPRRTRGNAALAACIGCTLEMLDSFESLLDDWFYSRYATEHGTENSHSSRPVLLACYERPDEEMYWRTVRGHVRLDDRENEILAVKHRVWSTSKGLNGIIGASAAIAWRGNHDCTWEYTAWRHKVGTPRNVPSTSVDDMYRNHPLTLLNRDPNAKRSLIAPRTPCPVLYGIRGETEDEVVSAHEYLQSLDIEQSKNGRAHRTNQATNDHISSIESGHISSKPIILRGGHVELDVGFKLVAFSQGGPVNRLAQTLCEGDHIEWRGLQSPDGSIHLEQLRIIHGIRNKRRPICQCGTRYKSKGRNQVLQCPHCKSLTDVEWDVDDISSEWVEPNASQRRHLSKPLSRQGKSEETT